MNQAVKSVVQKIPTNSDEYPMIQSICTHAVDENVTNSKAGKWSQFQQLLIKVVALPLSAKCFPTIKTTTMSIFRFLNRAKKC